MTTSYERIFGINKFAGTLPDRKRIAQELGLTKDDVINGKEISISQQALIHYCPTWFILKKEDRDFCDLEIF